MQCKDALNCVKTNTKSPKSKHIAGDLCICAVEVVIAHSSPDVVEEDLETSGVRQSVVTSKSHRY